MNPQIKHKQVTLLFMRGYSKKEVADEIGYHPVHVRWVANNLKKMSEEEFIQYIRNLDIPNYFR